MAHGRCNGRSRFSLGWLQDGWLDGDLNARAFSYEAIQYLDLYADGDAENLRMLAASLYSRSSDRTKFLRRAIQWSAEILVRSDVAAMVEIVAQALIAQHEIEEDQFELLCDDAGFFKGGFMKDGIWRRRFISKLMEVAA